MLSKLLLSIFFISAVLSQDSDDDTNTTEPATIEPATVKDGPILVEWKIQFDEATRSDTQNLLDKWMRAYSKKENEDVRVNTVGYYNQPDIIKQVIVFDNQAAMKTYAKNAQANSDLWDATTELRASWTESGTIYNGV